jgi:hypothetical protein
MQQASSNTVNLSGFNKVANVTAKVPFRQPGNIIEHVTVEFEVWRNESNFKALPKCSKETTRIADLPNAFQFQLKNGKITDFKQAYEEVVYDIGQELMKMKVV